MPSYNWIEVGATIVSKEARGAPGGRDKYHPGFEYRHNKNMVSGHSGLPYLGH